MYNRLLVTVCGAALVASVAVTDAAVAGDNAATSSGDDGTGEAVQLEEAQFGVFYKSEDDEWQFRETDSVANVAGTRYGWYLRLESPPPKVRVRERFTLPEPPKSWGGADTDMLQVSEDRKTATLEHTVSPNEGWVRGVWEVAEGDPSGRYRIAVFIEGELVKKFAFRVE